MHNRKNMMTMVVNDINNESKGNGFANSHVDDYNIISNNNSFNKNKRKEKLE